MPELFVEIGTEELPARFVGPAMEGLAAGLVKLLGSVQHGAVTTWGTPRRIAVAIADVAEHRPTVERVVTGPAWAAAFRDGAPTPVAESFAKAKGVDVASLTKLDTPKGPVVAARRVEGGEPVDALLAGGLEEAILAIPFKKSMKWSPGGVRFGRPIRHVCAIFGNRMLVATVAGLRVGDTSDGHWLLAPERFRVTSSAQWVAALRERYVEPDVATRRARIAAQLAAAAVEQKSVVEGDAELLDEVTNLVEWPTTIVGRFAEELLGLPPRLLIESMKKNQRYFPLHRNGALTNAFLTVTNNPAGDAELIAYGNACVIASRFHDAKFFYAEDRRKPLAVHGEKLASMTWIRGLGTMAERQVALGAAASSLAPLTGAHPGPALEAGNLCKSDLTTQMVGEFPELQGHVGRLLAELEGFDREVALAIEEHYHPRFTGDSLPKTATGRALALAERITLLTRTFAAGLAPKGSADQLGLRRAANGLVAIVLDTGLRLPLAELFAAAGETLTPELSDFVLARLRAQLQEEHPTDLVDAVVSTGDTDLFGLAERVRALAALPKEEFAAIRVAFRRAGGLVKDHASAAYDPARFEHHVERALHHALIGLPAAGTDVAAELRALRELRPVVDAFFDGVLVMTGDHHQNNRLGLLRAVTARFSKLADFTRLSTD